MNEQTVDAYRFLLCSAMLHIKWDLAPTFGRLEWWNPLAWMRLVRQAEIAGSRAFAFHNLAILMSRDLRGFEEDRFWDDIEWFRRKHPNAPNADYRGLFERKLAGEDVWIIQPL